MSEISNLVWDYDDDIGGWLEEKKKIMELSVDDENNLKKICFFISQTLNRICSPLKDGDTIPEILFEGIRELISAKIPK